MHEVLKSRTLLSNSARTSEHPAVSLHLFSTSVCLFCFANKIVPVDTKGKGWWGGRNWEIGIDIIYTTDTVYKTGK